MKKQGFALAAVFALSVAMMISGCSGATDPDTPDVPKDDVYEDYAPNKTPGGGQFEYNGNYSAPELTIDGKGDDPQWQAIEQPLLTYGRKVSDGQGGTVDAVSVKAYRGNNALFFLFDVKDSVLLTQGVTNDDAVTRGDSIEFYIDTKADGGKNPQSDDVQINLGIHGKTRIMKGAGVNWGGWNGLIDYEVDLKGGTLNDGDAANDTGYTVEVMIQYKDIMIEKDDTIGLAFGQVDKVRTDDAISGSETGPWNWYGWDFYGSKVDPQKPSTYVLFDKNGNLVSPSADVAGNVRDTAGNPVKDAVAKTTVDGAEMTAVTDEHGYFVFEGIDPVRDYTVVIEKEGYIALTETYTRAELREANGKAVLKEFTMIPTATLTYTTVTGTVKNVMHGAVGNATVAFKGTQISAETNADGAFSLANIPANNGEVTLVVTKDGYAASETKISASALVADGTTAIGDVNLNLPAGETGAFGTLQGLANNTAFISRSLTGIEIVFKGDNAFNGWIELFVDTKESTSARNATNAMYRFFADGHTDVTNYGGGFTTQGVEWNVFPADGGGYTAKAFIPYTTLAVGALEPFGVSFGQSNGQDVWNGWDRSDMIGTDGKAYVAPEIPTDYVRVGADNKLYEASHNNTLIAFGGTVKSGDTPLAGVSVKIGTLTAVTDKDGKWSLSAPVSEGTTEIIYSKAGYITETTEIEADAFKDTFSWSETVAMTERKVTVEGVVTDQDGAPVEGASVTLTVGGEQKTASTDKEGKYSFGGVATFDDVTVAFGKDGYAPVAQTTVKRETLESAEGGIYRLDKSLTALSQVRKINLTGKVVGVEGALQGVRVNGGAAVTGADGTFTLSDIDCVDGTIVLSLAGYTDGEYQFDANSVEAGVTDYVLPADIFLTRDYVQLGNAFGAKYAAFVPYVTRGETGFEFKFVGANAFDGRIELFVDTKLSNGTGGRNSTDYLFNLNANGSVTIVNWGNGGNETVPSDMKLTVSAEDNTVLFTLPYSFLGVSCGEIVGVTFGQFSASQNGWDGWGMTGDYASMTGVNGMAYVAPELTWDYIRIGVDNAPFCNAENKTLEELDLSQYNLHFGNKNDSIHAKVTRDETGITFEFVTLGDFNLHDGNPENPEAVLLYIDTGESVSGWDGVDYQYKIVSDGRVRAKNGAWWNIAAGDDKGNITINRENGVTRFSYKVLYTDIGISKDEVVGFTLAEGWLTGDNDSDEYSQGLLYTYDGENHVVGDAANSTQYVRIKADGSLAVADSNANVG